MFKISQKWVTLLNSGHDESWCQIIPNTNWELRLVYASIAYWKPRDRFLIVILHKWPSKHREYSVDTKWDAFFMWECSFKKIHPNFMIKGKRISIQAIYPYKVNLQWHFLDYQHTMHIFFDGVEYFAKLTIPQSQNEIAHNPTTISTASNLLFVKMNAVAS